VAPVEQQDDPQVGEGTADGVQRREHSTEIDAGLQRPGG
jgi:hypothetical protein